MWRYYSLAPRVLQTIAWVPGWLMLRWFLHLRIRGWDNVRTASKLARARGVGIIFACTHVSEFDPIIVLAGVPPYSRAFPMFYVSSPDKTFRDHRFGWRRFLYGGLFFRSWGAYPLVAQQKDYAKSLHAHVLLLEDGASLCVFPTGSIAREGVEYRIRGGVGYLTDAAKALVVPVRITKDSFERITVASFLKGTHYFTLTYGEPMQNERFSHGLATDDPQRYQTIAQRIMSSDI